MNITPPTSGTVSAHSAAPLQPANASLADLLLAGSPANSGQDFRAIAAALFGVESSTASPTQAPAKESTTGKKPVTSPFGETETRKSNESDDPGSAAAHPELTVPLPTLPAPLLDHTPKPEAVTARVGLPNLKATLKDPAMFTGRTASDSGEKLTNTASIKPPTVPDTPETIAPPSLFSELETQAPTVIKGDFQNELTPTPRGKTPWVERPAPADGVKQSKEPAAPMVASPPTSTTAKKSSDDGSNQPLSTELLKQVSTPAPDSIQANLPTYAPAAVNCVPEAPSAVDAATPAAMLEPTPASSASEILDKSITAKPAQASGPVDPNPAAGLSDGSPRTSLATSPKIKDREIKDRGIKDTRTVSIQRGKIAHAEAGNLVDGLTRSVATNSKDIAGVTLGTHSDTHAKAIALKQTTGTPSSQTAVAETDGPDEALPTSVPSPVTTAKLVQGMGQSEFRVGMQTQEFGNIDIRTSVARHMFSAQISVEHNDVAKSMTADLPALYHKLADQQVSVASIVIQGQSFATSSGLSQDAQPQTWRPQNYNITKSEAETSPPVLAETLDSGGRLDIRI